MSEIKLLNCPFCGGENVIETYISFMPVLQCADCRATMTFPASFQGNYKIELAKKWNTRKPMERIIERLEEAKRNETTFSASYPFESKISDEGIGYIRAIQIVKEEGGIE